MKFFTLFILLLTSCVSNKYSHNYFVNCEEKFSEFNELTSCAFKQIQQDCKKESDCKFENKRFVEFWDSVTAAKLNMEGEFTNLSTESLVIYPTRNYLISFKISLNLI